MKKTFLFGVSILTVILLSACNEESKIKNNDYFSHVLIQEANTMKSNESKTVEATKDYDSVVIIQPYIEAINDKINISRKLTEDIESLMTMAENYHLFVINNKSITYSEILGSNFKTPKDREMIIIKSPAKIVLTKTTDTNRPLILSSSR